MNKKIDYYKYIYDSLIFLFIIITGLYFLHSVSEHSKFIGKIYAILILLIDIVFSVRALKWSGMIE
jgi:hypothetical protein